MMLSSSLSSSIQDILSLKNRYTKSDPEPGNPKLSPSPAGSRDCLCRVMDLKGRIRNFVRVAERMVLKILACTAPNPPRVNKTLNANRISNRQQNQYEKSTQQDHVTLQSQPLTPKTYTTDLASNPKPHIARP